MHEKFEEIEQILLTKTQLVDLFHYIRTDLRSKPESSVQTLLKLKFQFPSYFMICSVNNLFIFLGRCPNETVGRCTKRAEERHG